MANSLLAIVPRREERRIITFIRHAISTSGTKGVVVGLSGGVDSAVVGSLCVRALGGEKVLAAMLPSRYTPPADMEDALRMATRWGVDRITVPISPLVEKLVAATGPIEARLPPANVQARVRMTILYYLANSKNLLVAGTGDRSEEMLGFFTKFGDGGVDLLPIAHLYKTQVRLLGEYLGLPPEVVKKPASPQLWPGHTAEEELPAGYEKLDVVMHFLFDVGASVPAASSKAGVSRIVVDRVLKMHARSAHKRALPISLRPTTSRTTLSRAKD